MLHSATERPGRVDGLGSADDWVDRSGRPGHVRGVDVLRVRGGKVAEKLSYVKG